MGPITFGGEGRTDNGTVSRDPPGLPDRGTLGLGEDGLYAVHATVEIVYL